MMTFSRNFEAKWNQTIKSQQYSSIRGRFNTAIIFIIKRWRFSLTKCEFFDAALLRYGENLNVYHTNMSGEKKYKINHVLTCKTGGFVTFHHNEIVNITADISLHMQKRMERACIKHDTKINDKLQADISGHSFFQRVQEAFVDVSYPFTTSYQNQSLAATMKTKENHKKKPTWESPMLKIALSPLFIYSQWWNKHRNKTILYTSQSIGMWNIRC